MQAELFLRPLRTVLDGLVRLSQTRSNYWAEFVVDGVLALGLLGAGLQAPGISMEHVLLTVLTGLLIFSFLEYAIHRWLFHSLNSVLAQGHEAHHQNPTGYDALPFFLPGLATLGLLGLFATVVPMHDAYLLSGAFTAGYVIYGASHHIIHHVRFQHPWAKRWAAVHHIHHVHPETNFGVTSPLWDVVMGTRYISRRNRRP